ncbi:uncharacterized [Tachysurus ichikawai]
MIHAVVGEWATCGKLGSIRSSNVVVLKASSASLDSEWFCLAVSAVSLCWCSEPSSSLSWVLSIKSFYGAYYWPLQLAAVLELNAFYGSIASLVELYSTVLLKALTGEKGRQVALRFFPLFIASSVNTYGNRGQLSSFVWPEK